MKLYINSLFVGLITFIYASVYWLNEIQFASTLTSLDMAKPFVYRQLVPFLARSLSYLGVRIDWAVCLVVTFFGVCLYLSMRRLYFYFYEQSDKGEIYVLVSVFVGMLLLGQERWMYDLATATFFTLALYFVFRVENWKYLVVFTLATLNRETSFLLILVYVVMLLYYKRYGVNYSWWTTACQIYIYFVITYSIRILFQFNVGSSVWIEPLENLHKYTTHPLETVIYLMIAVIILWRVFRNWNSKFFSLRLAFVVIAPILFVLYLVCGQAFEVRVFWEVYPLVVLLI
jgi:hypothetical protein